MRRDTNIALAHKIAALRNRGEKTASDKRISIDSVPGPMLPVLGALTAAPLGAAMALAVTRKKVPQWANQIAEVEFRPAKFTGRYIDDAVNKLIRDTEVSLRAKKHEPAFRRIVASGGALSGGSLGFQTGLELADRKKKKKRYKLASDRSGITYEDEATEIRRKRNALIGGGLGVLLTRSTLAGLGAWAGSSTARPAHGRRATADELRPRDKKLLRNANIVTGVMSGLSALGYAATAHGAAKGMSPAVKAGRILAGAAVGAGLSQLLFGIPMRKAITPYVIDKNHNKDD